MQVRDVKISRLIDESVKRKLVANYFDTGLTKSQYTDR